LSSPKTIQRILVPVGDLTRQTIGALRLAQILADVNQAEVVLLHVCDRKTPQTRVENFVSQLSEYYL
jgi:nucleotide-binding universal stress UspA family protein